VSRFTGERRAADTWGEFVAFCGIDRRT